MWTNLVLLVVFFAVVAMLIREGLWSNAVLFFNVMTAAMLASNYYEPLATFLQSKWPDYTYVWDFLSLWAIFAAVLVVLRLATDKISRHKVRFKLPVEWVGGIFFALWVGWIMVCFTTFTLHTAPLSRNFLGGTFQQEGPKGSNFFGLGPDWQWLAWMHTMSDDGALSHGRTEGSDVNVFDPKSDFILRYGARRKSFEGVQAIRANAGEIKY